MKLETKLARVFTALAESEQKTDTVASGILGIVAEAGVRDVESFNPLVVAAYTANGWNPQAGRPVAGAQKLEPVPATVRTYVTAIRRAFRRGIDVAKVKTFYELRKALRNRPAATQVRVPKEVRDNLAGVRLADSNGLNGALIHDVGAVYATLPKEHRGLFERQLQQLVSKYLPLARINRPEESKAATG